MTPMARGARAAAEAQALFAEWIARSEAAIAALEDQDTAGFADALRGREALQPRIEAAVREFDAARRALSAHARSQAERDQIGFLFPFAEISADLRECEARLAARLEASRAATRREIEQLEQGGSVASAYRQMEEAEPKTIDFVR